MWTLVARIILRNRILLLAILGLMTAFMAYKASFVQMSYEYAKMLPSNDTSYQEHLYFKKIFGEESNVVVIGFQDSNLFELSKFHEFKQVENRINELEGVSGVLSVTQSINLVKNKKDKRFEATQIFDKEISSQQELDNLKQKLENLPFYEHMLYNDTSNVYLVAVSLSKEMLNSKKRIPLIEKIHEEYEAFS